MAPADSDHSRTDRARVVVVGIGADGWVGLRAVSQDAIRRADVVLGATRQLDLLPTDVAATRTPWPSPLLPSLPGLLDEHAGGRLVILASGDPMHYGIGSSVIAHLGAERVHVITHPSSVALACARLGWPVESVEVVTAVGRPLDLVRRALTPGRRVLVLVGTKSAAADLARLVVDEGYGPSPMTLLTHLDGPDAKTWSSTAAQWEVPAHDALAIVAIHALADPSSSPRSTAPGLPDDAYEHDGQLTKHHVRAVTMGSLGPRPGEVLWDVGAGSGSIAIEWMRHHPSSHAVAVEPDFERVHRIRRNSARLGVPTLDVRQGSAPEILSSLPAPDAVFVGGGVSREGVLQACVDALGDRRHTRLVANAVTLESEAVLSGWYATLGGTLTRLRVEEASPVGGFTGWRPAMPVTQWRWSPADPTAGSAR